MKNLNKSLCFSLLVAVGCASRSGPDTRVAGKEKKFETKMFETEAKIVQGNAPVAQMDLHMIGFHPMKDRPDHQLEAHHFCRQMNEDFAQCALFDGNTGDANLNGVEYIISENLFNSLPPEEKQFWHPHNYEILSGQLITPNLPPSSEKEFMTKKMNSYGKTWHVWNTGHYGMKDGQSLPMGKPELAWSFNRDGEANAAMIEKAERQYRFKVKDRHGKRMDLVKLAHPQKGVDTLKDFFPVEGVAIEGVRDADTAQAMEE